MTQNGSAPVTTQHLLVRYAKRGKMRFASHLDVARAFERGVRRAGLPIAYSAGFTPHPKISYAGGAPTGVASEAEYLSLTLTSRTEADAVRERLNAALPDGIDVITVTEDSGGLPASRLTASEWQVALPGLRPDDVVPVVQKFLALTEAPVERLTSKGMRRMDARAAVVSLDVLDDVPMHADGGFMGARRSGQRLGRCAWSSGTPPRLFARTTCSTRYETFPMCSLPGSRS